MARLGAAVNACGGTPTKRASALLALRVMANDFELLSEVTHIEVIAVNLSIQERKRLKAQFGIRRRRKLKEVGRGRFPNGEIRQAELHWYEARGIERRKMKVKHVLD